jgi:Tetratricopeptide repeat
VTRVILAAAIVVGGCAPRSADEAASAIPPGPSPRLVARPAPPDSGGVRTVEVTLVTDSSFRERGEWRGVARRAIEDRTADLAELAGLRFRVVDETAWDPPAGTRSLEEALRLGVAAVGPRPGLTVFVLGKRPKNVDPTHLGYSFLGEPAMVLVAPAYPDRPFARPLRESLGLEFRHELGHVFGIPHLKGKNVMNPSLDGRDERFTDLAVEILRACRGMELRPGSCFAGCDLHLLRDVYLVLDERGEMDTPLLVDLGVALRREGEPAAAREVYEAALRRSPRLLEARFGLAQCAIALGDTSRVRALTGELGGEPGLTPEMLGVLGTLRLQLGEYADAESLLDRAVAARPDRFSFVFNRGLARFRLDRYAEAAADFEAALAVEERPEGWFNLGLARDALGEKRKAEAAFSRYLELAPAGERRDDALKFLDRNRQ